MQFLVLGYDGEDADALKRRMAARPEHLALANRLVGEGKHIFGVALLGETGDMAGSAMVVDFPDRASLDAWLREEPYVTGGVWHKIEVLPCKSVPPSSIGWNKGRLSPRTRNRKFLKAP